MNLPDKLSDLLELALSDLAKVEVDPDYRVDMEHLHYPSSVYEGVCYVCLAGAVLAKTLAMPITRDYLFGAALAKDILPHNLPKLTALDSLRLGQVENAAYILDILDMEDVLDRSITPYDVDAVKFRKDLESLVKDLRKEGY